MEHTAGPWFVRHSGCLGFHVCSMHPDGTSHGRIDVAAHVPTEGNAEANAKLIAAAPALLQEARCALADLEGMMEAHDPDGYHPGWATIRELRVVIAEATE